MMGFRIVPNELYSVNELRERLKEVEIDYGRFIERTRPRKVFKAAYLGLDLLNALMTAPALQQGPGPPLPQKTLPCPKRRTGFSPITQEEILDVED